MRKVCFVSYANLYLVPYLKNYTDQIDGVCDVIVWNRHDCKESCKKCNVISYDYSISDNTAKKTHKLKGYLGFTRFVKQHLLKGKYDVVICLQSIASIFNAYTLLKRYKQSYVIDIRDYSVEGNRILKWLEGKMMASSRINIISSEGYKSFLPENRIYQLVHNYSPIDPDILKIFNGYREIKKPIRLSYIGLIRFQEQNKKIIDLFANDDRFLVNFIGKNALELKSYISEHNISNVRLVDQFPSEQTLEYYQETDAILNVYGNHTPLLDYALSNKLYFAAALKMPILVSKNTFMEQKSLQGGFGFVLDFEDKIIKEKLIDYMYNRDIDTFIKNCDTFMNEVIRVNAEFSSTMKKLLN